MPACAGMTEPERLFVVHIIPSYVFSKEDVKNAKFGDLVIQPFVTYVRVTPDERLTASDSAVCQLVIPRLDGSVVRSACTCLMPGIASM